MNIGDATRKARGALPWLLLLYAGTSLLHFAHNAERLAQYPNLPVSWSRADVYFAWCAVTTVGLLGYVLFRAGCRRAGLAVLAIYAGLGFGGLLHYIRAPIAHHSATMNLTIWAEVAAAAVLLINVVTVATQEVRAVPRLPPDNRWGGRERLVGTCRGRWKTMCTPGA